MRTLISNAILVLPEQVLENGWLLIEDEHIAALGVGTAPLHASHVIDAESQYLLPGLIDLHCDAIEKLIEPRPGILFDVHLALQEADWRLAGCGITTEFHAVSLDDDEFSVRCEGFVQNLSRAIEERGDGLLVRHRIHARLELSSRAGGETVAGLIEQRACHLVSLMDHSPGQGQYRTVEAYRDYIARMTQRSHEEIDALIRLKQMRAVEKPARMAHVARLAREAGLAIATHDDDSAASVELWPELGVTISEFPTTLEAARRAHELGLTVCMGAPNVLRGRSSSGNLSALEALRAGITDVLCSDYHPLALLAAPFLLAKQQIMTLNQAACLVTLHPARAVKMDHAYGSLEAGKMADLVLVRLTAQGWPRVQRLFVGGQERLLAH